MALAVINTGAQVTLVRHLGVQVQAGLQVEVCNLLFVIVAALISQAAIYCQTIRELPTYGNTV